MSTSGIVAMVILLLLAAACHAQDPNSRVDRSAVITGKVFDETKGVWRHKVSSQFMGGINDVEVLLPDSFDKTRQYRVLYVLPVERGIGGRFGDGLEEIRKADLHNTFGLICVTMAFDTVPWYADHPTDANLRHESYIKKVIVPMIESRYPTVGGPEGRMLLGFSKSGWGALTLILRDPNFFDRAASWDAPLMLQDWMPSWGMDQAFGTIENYQQYRPANLFQSAAGAFRDRTRLVVMGEASFGSEPGGKFKDKHQTVLAHEAMTAAGILHTFSDKVRAPHTWNAQWLRPAIEALMALDNQKPVSRPSTQTKPS